MFLPIVGKVENPLGIISDMAKAKFPGQGTGTSTWDRLVADKERQHRNVRGANTWTASASQSAAVERLIIALRSMAPGGWSDNRYEQAKHYTGSVYVAINRIMKQMGRTEFQVFRKDPTHPDGKVSVEADHPLIKLLEKPNRQDSWSKIMQRWSQQMQLTGTALTYMLPNVMGTPMELYCIPTAIAIPQPTINPDFPDGFYRIQPLYPYGPFSSYPTPNSAVGAPIPAQWMMRFQYPHPLLRYEGYSPLTGMASQIDQVEQMDRSRWYSMKRAINPAGVLNMDEIEGMAMGLPEAEIERIHAEWEKFQGSENSGKLIVGYPGSKLEQFGTKPIDMDYANGWDQMMNFVLGGGFGITKPAAGMVEDSSYSNLYATLKQLHELTLQPDADDIASDLTRQLAPFFGDDLIIEVRCRRIDDHEITFNKANQLVGWKGLPVPVIEYLMRMLDLPINKQMIEELSKAGQEQMPPGGMPGAPPPGMDPGAMDPAALQESGEQVLAGIGGEPPVDEVEAARPTPGPLGEGSLGPRMKMLTSLMNGHKNGNGHRKPPAAQSIYDRVRKACKNGH